MLTENYVKAGNVMEINIQGYKSAFTGWSFYWLSQRIAQWSFVVSSHVAIGHSST